MSESVKTSVEVAAPLTHVFDTFARELGDWWPTEYTFSGQQLSAMGIDHLSGGSWFEVDSAGQRIDWGEVLAWEPPDRAILTWRVSATRTQEAPENASEVEFIFQQLAPAKTLVQVEHRNFSRHGEGAAALETGMRSDQGWKLILDSLATAAAWPVQAADDGHQVL